MNTQKSLPINCLACGAAYKVNVRFAGRKVRCPQCENVVTVGSIPEELSQSPEQLTKSGYGEAEASEPLNNALTNENRTKTPHQTPSKVFVESSQTSKTKHIQEAHSNDSEEDEEPIPQRPEWHDEELDMTPMVDVTFLLLIFFMVTASFSLQKSMESARQKSDAPGTSSQPEVTEELDMVTVQINEFGSFLVMAPDWERETPGKQNLIRALQDAIGDGSTPMKLAIEVHENAKLQSLVDCMDAGMLADYGEVRVTQVEGFD